VAHLFFLLSGEHEDLPVSELKAILETEGYTYTVTEKLEQVLRLDAHPDCVEALKCRAAFTRLCALELFTCEAKTNSIIKALYEANLNQALTENETFVVRVKHVRIYSSEIDGMVIEQKLGELILQIAPGTKVKLRNPDKTLIGILTNNKFIFGIKLIDIPATPFVERRPRKRPFFHPSAMQAKLARCMVNLAHPKTGDLIIDPFCGTGTMLIEAALIGCRAVGLDVQRRMARGTLRNMEHFKVKPEGIIVTDARTLPISKLDCVVTDPPYGTSSTTLKRTTKQIIEEILATVYDLLSKGKRICLAAPKKLNIVQTGTDLGYRHIESHFVYVHRSLTREIVVFEKV
jgi:tRNA (guanine10-N2)-dimethyltransferase